MSANLLKKKIFAVAGYAAAILFTLFFMGYAWVLRCATVYHVSQSFYFLVADSTHVEASAYIATLQGGAGYLLQADGREYSALSVYLSEDEGRQAQKALCAEEYILLEKRVEKLYFKTRAEKMKSNAVLNALRCLHDSIEVLSGEIRRLEEGATQESSKQTLGILAKQFSHLQMEYGATFGKFSAICAHAKAEIEKSVAGIVYSRELRYLSCMLCDSYMHLCEEFSI